MDSRNQAPIKSSSFSTAITKNREVDRNFSLGSVRHGGQDMRGVAGFGGEEIKEEDGEEEGDGGGGGGRGAAGEPGTSELSAEVDAFIAGRDGHTPEATLERYAAAVEMEIANAESGQGKWCACAADPSGEPPVLLAVITRVALLSKRSVPGSAVAQRVTGVCQRAMAFLEDEFHVLLEPRADSCKLVRRPPSFEQGHEQDRCILIRDDDDGRELAPVAPPPPYPAQTVNLMRSIADAMVTAGYATECTQMFLVARRLAFDESLRALGYLKVSTDDVVKMALEALEAEVETWIKAFRHTVDVGLPREHELCGRVFAGRHAAVGRGVFAHLARCVMLDMLSFVDGVAMTKRSAEKLFPVLHMYEAVRDASAAIDTFILLASADEPAAEAEADRNSTALADLKAEIVATRSRLGESAATIFSELERSIRADAGKQPVPGGAVHPLTRYVMSYVNHTCEYSGTMEQVFREHRQHGGGGGESGDNQFVAELTAAMELLQENLEGKSRLYKDPALSSIFLMNNGRYMLQKLRGSPETNALLGETWARKQSTELRQYHKNYQRETWSRVLTLLRDDGAITVKGKVQKPVLKERFKQFNAAMEEIQRTQGAWVVSDEQLQSELRVSIAAVVVPAYRSFLGRFGQAFSARRQSEKYVKLTAEDLEGIIDELFECNTASRRRT